MSDKGPPRRKQRLLWRNLAKVARPPLTTPQWKDAIREDESRGKKENKSALAKQVGALIAERAKAAGVTKVAFDRGGYAYHGRIAALADAAREGGLEF